MEIRSIKIKTTHDLRPVLELLDRTEETVESIMLLIALGAARAAEFAANEADGLTQHRADGVINTVENIFEEWWFTHGKG